MYEREEIDAVIKDISDVLNKFEVSLDLITADLHVANKNLNSVAALSALRQIRDRLDKINLDPVVDTLEGVLVDQAKSL